MFRTSFFFFGNNGKLLSENYLKKLANFFILWYSYMALSDASIV